MLYPVLAYLLNYVKRSTINQVNLLQYKKL